MSATVSVPSPDPSIPECDTRYNAWLKRQLGRASQGHGQIKLAGHTVVVGQPSTTRALDRVQALLNDIDTSSDVAAELDSRHRGGQIVCEPWTDEQEYDLYSRVEAGRDHWSKPPKRHKRGEVPAGEAVEVEADDDAGEDSSHEAEPNELPVFDPNAPDDGDADDEASPLAGAA